MVHPPLKSFRVHFEYIFFWSGRVENPIREKYVSMLDHPWFFALFLLLRAAELCRDTENQIACASLIANLFIYYFFFFHQRTYDEEFYKNRRKYVAYIRSNYYIFFVYVYSKTYSLYSFLLYSLPARFLRHLVRRVSIDAFATRIEQPSPGRYLMKRQSHLRIAISNSARQRRTRGRVGGRRQRSRSAVTR